MKNIYLDESGNTGANLLDVRQPVFTLASNDYSDDESSQLLKCIKSSQGAEIKFSSLKKSNKGRKKLIEFFKQELLGKNRVKITVSHKKFMALSKVIDLLVETFAHETGFDIYENGLNISMSNMHYQCMPAFCGQDRFNVFLDTFILMIKNKTPASIELFYNSVEDLYKNNISDERYLILLSPILKSRVIIDELLEGIDYFTLDPAIPSLFNHCTSWGETFKDEFIIVHDSSKPIKAQLDVFNKIMKKNIPYTEIGYDRRKFTLPLRSTEIKFEDSKEVKQIQISDLVASSMAYLANSIESGNSDVFASKLRDCGIESFMINTIWPSEDVTPEELGTEESGGINAANFMADL